MDARSLLMQSRRRMPGMTSLSGYTPGAGMTDDQFRDAAGTVTADDLRGLGISVAPQPFDAAGTAPIDPAAMKFDAMMSLKRAQRQGFGVERAQQRLADVDMVEAGRDEVLRRRQNDFNEAARRPQLSDTYGEAYSYMRPDQKIAGLTGAAMASQARGGRAQLSLPGERHDPQVRMQSMLSGLGRARTGY